MSKDILIKVGDNILKVGDNLISPYQGSDIYPDLLSSYLFSYFYNPYNVIVPAGTPTPSVYWADTKEWYTMTEWINLIQSMGFSPSNINGPQDQTYSVDKTIVVEEYHAHLNDDGPYKYDLTFNASYGYLNSNTDYKTFVDNYNDFSISCWIKTIDASMILISIDGSVGNIDKKVCFSINNGTLQIERINKLNMGGVDLDYGNITPMVFTPHVNAKGSISVVDNSWHHVAVVYKNKNSYLTAATFYVDGVKDTTQPPDYYWQAYYNANMGGPSNVLGDTQQVTILGSKRTPFTRKSCSLQRINIFRKALTEEEVNIIYNHEIILI